MVFSHVKHKLLCHPLWHGKCKPRLVALTGTWINIWLVVNSNVMFSSWWPGGCEFWFHLVLIIIIHLWTSTEVIGCCCFLSLISPHIIWLDRLEIWSHVLFGRILTTVLQGCHDRGLYRVHQFSKVEMFVISRPEESDALHEELISIEEELYSSLGLHFK